MRVFLTTIGSRGDVEPFLALAAGLQAAGHPATLSTADRFTDAIEARGVRPAPTSNALLDLLDTPEVREVMETMTNAAVVLKSVRAMIRRMAPVHRRLIADTWAAIQDAAPDVVVYHPKAFWGADHAFALGVPAVMAPLQPVVVPTGERPAMGFVDLPLGPAYRRGTHQLLLALSRWGTRRYLADWRAETNALERPSILQMPDGTPIPVANAWSRHVVPVPSDWPPHVVATGYWAVDAPDALAPEIEAFLDAGPPPVYVGFGSMAGRDPGATTRLVVEAVRAAGVRAVLATGWGGLDGVAGDDVLTIEGAPHAALFPRCAAVVHHGGAGTTAAGLRAGRPTVVVAHFADQPYWGRRVAAIGAGPAPLLKKRLTAPALLGAIHRATTSDAIRERARAVGAALRAEDGVAAAVRFIEAQA